MDQHALVAAVKELALELGHTPRRSDLEARVKGGKYALDRLFGGSFSALLTAAGFETYGERRKGSGARKIDNSIFERDIIQHLEEYQPKIIAPPIQDAGKYVRTLYIGDCHFPFANKRVLDAIYRFAEKEQPDEIVQVGDLYDFLSHGKFARSHNTFTPREEQKLGRQMADEMWTEVKKACPRAKMTLLRGNHDARPLKRILEVYPEAEDWVAEMLNRLMTFEGVTTMEDHRQEYIQPGNVMVHHGYMGRTGAHRDYNVGYNFVFGHTHTGHVVYRQIQGSVRWELNVGYVADPASKGLSYTPQRQVGWTPGWGFLDEYGPRFIPFSP